MVPWRWVEIVPLLRLPLCAVSSVVCVVRRFVCRCVIRVWILPVRCLASVGTVLAVVCLLFRRAVVLCFWDVVLRCPCGVPVSLPGFCLCFLWLVVRRGCRWLVFYGFPTRRQSRLFAMVFVCFCGSGLRGGGSSCMFVSCCSARRPCSGRTGRLAGAVVV